MVTFLAQMAVKIPRFCVDCSVQLELASKNKKGF
jgi:hypothetical protein